MSISITIVGAQDPAIEQRLIAAGLRPVKVPVTDLSLLANPLSAPPDVLVVDLRGQSQVPEPLSAIRRQHPDTGLIIVASSLDPSLMLAAMRSGVTECVTDLERGDLEASINRLVADRAPVETGDVFVFVGAKGGVGTTTLAVNVAAALAKLGKTGSTLLIDLHLTGGDAALFLGTESRFSVIDALENTHRLDAAYFRGLVDRTKSGLDLLASTDRAVSTSLDPLRLRTLINFAARHYRYTIIDVARSDAAVLDALEGVSKIIVVLNQELAAVRGASRIITALKQRYGKDGVSAVVTRSDRRAEISIEDLERAISMKLTHVLPSDYRIAVDALNRGRPLVHDEQSELASACRSFARSLAGVEQPTSKTKTGSTGLLARLTGRN